MCRQWIKFIWKWASFQEIVRGKKISWIFLLYFGFVKVTCYVCPLNSIHTLYNTGRWCHHHLEYSMTDPCHGFVFSCPLTGERWILRRTDPGDSSQGFVLSVWCLGENTVSRHCQSDQEDTETCKLHKLQVYVPSLETLHGQVKWGVLVNTELSRTLN